MATYGVTDTQLTAIADAIRLKRDIVSDITVDDMPTQIGLIEGESHNWSAIGYSGEPEFIGDGYDYAVQIKENWTNIANLQSKFANNNDLIIMPLVDTSNATSMFYMFANCKILQCIPLLNTENVNNMRQMFEGCNIKEIPLFDTQKVTDMFSMFFSCLYLDTIPQFDVRNVTTMERMFGGSNIKTIPSLNAKKNTSMSIWCRNAKLLENIGVIDCDEVTNILYAFQNCNKLENLGGFANLGKAYSTTKSADAEEYELDLSYSSVLTKQSVLNVFNNLYDIATKGCNTQKIKLKGIVYDQLSQAELNIAINKGWNIARIA